MIYIILPAIRNGDDIEIVNDEYENDYVNFNDFITSNHYTRRKNTTEIIKLRKTRSYIYHFK